MARLHDFKLFEFAFALCILAFFFTDGLAKRTVIAATELTGRPLLPLRQRHAAGSGAPASPRHGHGQVQAKATAARTNAETSFWSSSACFPLLELLRRGTPAGCAGCFGRVRPEPQVHAYQDRIEEFWTPRGNSPRSDAFFSPRSQQGSPRAAASPRSGRSNPAPTVSFTGEWLCPRGGMQFFAQDGSQQTSAAWAAANLPSWVPSSVASISPPSLSQTVVHDDDRIFISQMYEGIPYFATFMMNRFGVKPGAQYDYKLPSKEANQLRRTERGDVNLNIRVHDDWTFKDVQASDRLPRSDQAYGSGADPASKISILWLTWITGREARAGTTVEGERVICRLCPTDDSLVLVAKEWTQKKGQDVIVYTFRYLLGANMYIENLAASTGWTIVKVFNRVA